MLFLRCSVQFCDFWSEFFQHRIWTARPKRYPALFFYFQSSYGRFGNFRMNNSSMSRTKIKKAGFQFVGWWITNIVSAHYTPKCPKLSRHDQYTALAVSWLAKILTVRVGAESEKHSNKYMGFAADAARSMQRSTRPWYWLPVGIGVTPACCGISGFVILWRTGTCTIHCRRAI